MTKNNLIDAQKKVMHRCLLNKVVVFDPFKCYYEVLTPNLEESQEAKTSLERNLPKLNESLIKLERIKSFQEQLMLLDKGTLPTGKTDQQLKSQMKKTLNPKIS